jgi:hypothetical protein
MGLFLFIWFLVGEFGKFGSGFKITIIIKQLINLFILFRQWLGVQSGEFGKF